MQIGKSGILVAVGVVFAALTMTGCVGFTNAMADPVQRSARVAAPNLPSDTAPVTIALISDIHVGNAVMRPERLRAIVRAVNAAQPDIVVLAGDFVIGESPGSAAGLSEDLDPLAGLRARDGVYAVLGNHDHWTDPVAVTRSLERAGVSVLRNDARRIGPLALVGIDDRFSGHDDIRQSLSAARSVGGIPVVVTHSPDLARDLPADVPLVLAGHTHCGQMVAPGLGPLVEFHRGLRLYEPRYRCGRVREEGRTVIVTAGVGSGAVPFRFGAQPDWWLVTVQPG